MYYNLTDDLSIPDRWYLDEIYSSDGEIDIWEYNSIGPITVPDARLTVDVSYDGAPLDITFAGFDVLIGSSKVKELFDKEEVELLPISIKQIPTAEFYVIKILKEVDCIDREKSDFTVWEKDDPIRPDLEGEFSSFFEMVVNPAMLAGYDIVRVKGYNNAIIVSDNLKGKMEKLKISGVLFESV
ncbi:DUF1629 domain-containing protein [Chitinophaga sp. CB10]|uniref:imm11 family protein n=1 Tax=Chitinophaga sp. CB10 TaxID=1891659 RepID=UPI0025C4799D|nr:DUF1629 domain-containing protein [Chitinophaga sp. CB10]